MVSKDITEMIYDLDHTATSLEDLTRLLVAVTRDIARHTGGLSKEHILMQMAENDIERRTKCPEFTPLNPTKQ